jgi:hypothetical protein
MQTAMCLLHADACGRLHHMAAPEYHYIGVITTAPHHPAVAFNVAPGP